MWNHSEVMVVAVLALMGGGILGLGCAILMASAREDAARERKRVRRDPYE